MNRQTAPNLLPRSVPHRGLRRRKCRRLILASRVSASANSWGSTRWPRGVATPPVLAADQGVFLVRAPRTERRVLVALLPANDLSDIPDEAPTEAAAVTVRELRSHRAAELLDDVDPHTVADILRELPYAEAAGMVACLHRPEDVAALPQYPPDSAGGMMTLDFPHIRHNITVGNALDVLRLFREDAEGFGVCILDDGQRLMGAVSITQLALASPARSADDLAEQYGHRLVSVSPDTDRREPHRLMSRYPMSIIPVVDENRRVLGVIRAEEAMQIGEEDEAAAAMLAAFLPVGAGQGGIAGTRTVTLVVLGLALGEAPHHSGVRLLGRELLLGSFQCLVLVAALAGLGVPLIFRRPGIDRTVSSAVLVTTFTDLLGFEFSRGRRSARALGGMTHLVQPCRSQPCYKS